MNCETCKERQKQAEPVPFIVHESAMARMERANKRLWIVILILILLFVATNAGWIYYESQFEAFETWQEVTQEADGNGNNSFIGGNYYGEADGNYPDEGPEA